MSLLLIFPPDAGYVPLMFIDSDLRIWKWTGTDRRGGRMLRKEEASVARDGSRRCPRLLNAAQGRAGPDRHYWTEP